ncbi:MAG TPA: dihydropteroate synthase [Longimicrobiales bacterium]|nr:dihydropteroate synthase [Longimicrobiales bacterium]
MTDLAPADAPTLPARAGIGPQARIDPRAASWRTRRGVLPLDRPRIMGVLNVTPDSFWEGSRTAAVDDALRRAGEMVAAGADLLDVGGESTRPGADPVAAEEEARRVVPVLRAIARRWPELLLSVDTVKAPVAAAALDAGAAVINDVSAFRVDPAMARLAADAGAGVVLMHSRGGVDRMAAYESAVYGADVAGEVAAELGAAAARARSAGIHRDAIVLDPGLGFAKRTADTVAVLRSLHRLRDLGYPVLVGPSRKRFIGELAGGVPVEERLPGTIAACVVAHLAGARLFRVHDVAPVRQALDVAEALVP